MGEVEFSAGALHGIRVLELGRVLAAPFAAQILGDLGAEVVKIERPGAGDDSRRYGIHSLPAADGGPSDESAMFLSVNRNKLSVTADISTPAGQEIVRKLADQSDVLIENYKVGALARFGLDYTRLRESNPRLIYCSVTGYGQTGPERSRPGYDQIFQAECGLMSLNGYADGRPGAGPLKIAPSLVDTTSGLYSVIAILAALRHRDRTGEGQSIDIALLDTAIAMTGGAAIEYLVSGILPERTGNENNATMPCQILPCIDGGLYVIAGNTPHFQALAATLGIPELAENPLFSTGRLRGANRDQLTSRLEAASGRWRIDALFAALSKAQIPCGRVNDLAQAFAEPQAQARGVTVRSPHPLDPDLKLLKNPVGLSASPPASILPPPLLGEHTDATLTRLLGLSPAEIARLRESGAI